MTTQQFSLWHGRSIEERFMAFDAKHPDVYAALVRLTYEARDAGRSRIGVRTLWERLRWQMHIEKGDETFKLNDHFTSRYVRKLIREYPDVASMFELRELRAV